MSVLRLELLAVLAVFLGPPTFADPAAGAPPPNNVEHAGSRLIVGLDVRDRASLDSLDTAFGVRRATPILDGIHVLDLEPGVDLGRALAAYRDDPNVAFAEPDLVVTAQALPDDPLFHSWGGWNQAYDDQWGLKKIDAPRAWDITTGSERIVIAVVDTGVDYTHEDLQGNIWINPGEDLNGNGIADPEDLNGVDDDGNGFVDDLRGFDFVTCNEFNFVGSCLVGQLPDNDPMDEHYHGTHVAGIAAARGNNGTGIAGVMWNAKVMPVRGLNRQGAGLLSELMQGIVYAAENGAHVINNSWSRALPGKAPESLVRVVDYAASRGAVIVAAAGNSGRVTGDEQHGHIPGSVDGVIAVAASDVRDGRCYFSNAGYGTDLFAPGGNGRFDFPVSSAVANVVSLRLDDSRPALAVGESYLRLAGTSMAAPHVAGLAGLILAHRPLLPSSMVRIAMLEGADELGPHDDRINAYKSLLVAEAIAARPRPELELKRFTSRPGSILPGESVTASVTLENIGLRDAEAFVVELTDDATDAGRQHADWLVPSLAPGRSLKLEREIRFDSLGEYELSAAIDGRGVANEITRKNNSDSASISVVPYRLLETLYKGDVYSFDISGTRFVWILPSRVIPQPNTINRVFELFMYDLGKDRTYGSADDSGEILISDRVHGQHGSAEIAIRGNKIAYIRLEDPQGGPARGTSLVVYDLGSDGVHNPETDASEGERFVFDGRMKRFLFSGNKFFFKLRYSMRGDYVYDLGPNGVADGLENPAGDDTLHLLESGDVEDHFESSYAQVALTDFMIVWAARTRVYEVDGLPRSDSTVLMRHFGPDRRPDTADDRPTVALSDESRSLKIAISVDGSRVLWAEDDRSFPRDLHLINSFFHFYDLGADLEHDTGDDTPLTVLPTSPTGVSSRNGYTHSNNKLLWNARGLRGDLGIFDFGPDGKYGTRDDLDVLLHQGPASRGRMILDDDLMVYLRRDSGFPSLYLGRLIEPASK
ncbi:MAG: S8 family serine peptidase [bacterium]|nr:S8 family serine peptidase [bacterium]